MPAGPGTDNPLMNADGTPRLFIDAGERLERGDVSAVLIAGEAPGLAHARETHQLRPRVYAFAMAPALPDEVAAVEEAWRATRGGAGSTRWRHPMDDAAGDADNIETAPAWRITSLRVNRGGGAMTNVQIELTEVIGSDRDPSTQSNPLLIGA